MKAILSTQYGEHVASHDIGEDAPDVIRQGDRFFVQDDQYSLLEDTGDDQLLNYREAFVLALPVVGRQG